MSKTTIEWTKWAWNPMRGCDQVTAGCKNCYAKTIAERFRGVAGSAYEQGFDFRLVPDKLTEPLRLTKPQMVFVNSMSDLFHEEGPDEYLRQVAWVMRAADWHIYQPLTKRAQRMHDLLRGKLAASAGAPHIWWGVSVENKKQGLPRVDLLRESGAEVKWLSVEPLLEDLGEFDLSGIDWVVVGGESGPEARPMEREWVESILAQCQNAQVPFFFKQWGGVHKHDTGRVLNGRIYNEMPPIIVRPVADAEAREHRVAVVQTWIEDARKPGVQS